MKHLGLFEGIGGFSLAAKWMGWETLAWCEWNPFGQKILRHYFPEAEGFSDITKTDFTKYANRIDILTGGFPCQPYSIAGKRLGKEDERHLWPEMLRAIREIQPKYVVGENVSGLINWNAGMVFNEVQADLEAAGYEVLPFVLPACAVNAPHKRDRVWFVAYSGSNGYKLRGHRKDRFTESESQSIKKQRERFWSDAGRISKQDITPNPDSRECQKRLPGRKLQNGKEKEGGLDSGLTRHGNGGDAANTQIEGAIGLPIRKETQNSKHGIIGGYGDATDTNGIGLRGQSDWIRESGQLNKASESYDWSNFPTQSPVCSGNDGVPNGLDGITFSKWRNESIKAYGNAIVPQVALQIFKAIQSMDT